MRRQSQIDDEPRMNHDMLVEAIQKHMEALDKVTTWGVLLVGAILGASVVPDESIEIAQLKFKAKEAGVAVGIVYCIVNIYISILIGRLYYLLAKLEDSIALERALTAMATSAWVMNPFSYFGSQRWSFYVNYFGLVISTSAWTISLGSLLALRKAKEGSYDKFVYFLTALVLATAVYAVWQVALCFRCLAEKTTRDESVKKLIGRIRGRLNESYYSILIGELAGSTVLCLRWLGAGRQDYWLDWLARGLVCLVVVLLFGRLDQKGAIHTPLSVLVSAFGQATLLDMALQFMWLGADKPLAALMLLFIAVNLGLSVTVAADYAHDAGLERTLRARAARPQSHVGTNTR